MTDWLVNDRGVVQLDQGLAQISSGEDTAGPSSGAVVDAGVVHVRSSGCVTKISLNPKSISRTTMITVFHLVAETAPERVVLACADAAPTFEMYCEIGEAFARIESLVGRTPFWPRPMLSVVRRPVARPRRSCREQVTSLLAVWSERRALWSADLPSVLDRSKLLDDAVLVRNPHGTARLVIEHWGARRDFYGPDWIQLAPGSDIEDQPFQELAAGFGAHYRQAMAECEPRLHDVDIIVARAEGPPMRRQFDRLLLPWRGPDGENYATTINFERRAEIASR
jgi:hypothetical protein